MNRNIIRYGDVEIKYSELKFRRQNRPIYSGLNVRQLAAHGGTGRVNLLFYISEVQKVLLEFPDVTCGFYYLALWQLLLGIDSHNTGPEHVRFCYPIFEDATRSCVRFLALNPKGESGYYLLERIFAMMDYRAKEARVWSEARTSVPKAAHSGVVEIQYRPINQANFRGRTEEVIDACERKPRRERLSLFLKKVPVCAK